MKKAKLTDTVRIAAKYGISLQGKGSEVLQNLRTINTIYLIEKSN